MAGKQAKVLSATQLSAALRRVRGGRHPDRDQAMLLLSAKAGLRASEIAKLTWAMVLRANGQVADRIELHDAAAKKRSGRTIPVHPALCDLLVRLRQDSAGVGAVIRSERGKAMRPSSVVTWFWLLYRDLGLAGCSSHSGRRTFITQAARMVHRVGGSIRDVQQLAGHRSLNQTQAYIDGDTNAQRRLVSLL